jgi:hypothetical protein
MRSFLGLGAQALVRSITGLVQLIALTESLAFSQLCSLSLILPEMLHFLLKTYKTRKIQK